MLYTAWLGVQGEGRTAGAPAMDAMRLFKLTILKLRLTHIKINLFFGPPKQNGAGLGHKESLLTTWGKSNEKPIFENQTKFVKRKVECTVVIFGRSFLLYFFVLKVLEIMKNDTIL